MKKVLVYGRSGGFFRGDRSLIPSDEEIVAWGNSSPERATSFCGKRVDGLEVLSPDEIKNRHDEFDLIYIANGYINAGKIMWNLCTSDTGNKVPAEKIRLLSLDHESEKNISFQTTDDNCILVTIGRVKIKETSVNDAKLIPEIFL
ncbi:MAG: hypothetical protein IJ617_02275 [Oscillospiraceae bacterium]|nr:hypothetical protein [Oscillospiraceae bacterium]